VHNGTAHAALVYDGDDCVGWCQFGSTDELPRIKRRRAYESVEVRVPDWRITCFFVDKEYRGQGIASVALRGALREIARMGGGLVESFPEDVTDRRTSGGSCTTRRLQFSSGRASRASVSSASTTG
jgi:GNAT superfamily N-acetyltransferase